MIVANVGLNQLDQVGGLTFVGQNDQLAGQEAGTVMAAAGPRHALCVIHEADNTALTDRCAGFAGQLTKAGRHDRGCCRSTAPTSRAPRPRSRRR